jgi:hypothetical protein
MDPCWLIKLVGNNAPSQLTETVTAQTERLPRNIRSSKKPVDTLIGILKLRYCLPLDVKYGKLDTTSWGCHKCVYGSNNRNTGKAFGRTICSAPVQVSRIHRVRASRNTNQLDNRTRHRYTNTGRWTLLSVTSRKNLTVANLKCLVRA